MAFSRAPHWWPHHLAVEQKIFKHRLAADQIGLEAHNYPPEIYKHPVACTSVLLAYGLIQFSKTNDVKMVSSWRVHTHVILGKVYYGNVVVFKQ